MSAINPAPPVAFSGNVTLGSVEIQDLNGNIAGVTTQQADNGSNTSNRLEVSARLNGFNGSTWDRVRSGIISATSNFLGFLNVLPFARYLATQPTLIDGQGSPLQTDSSGNLRVTLATAIEGEDSAAHVMKVEQRMAFAHIGAGQATTVVKASSGFLHSITFNGPATATNVTTVYDNPSTSGTVIAIPLATGATIPTTLVYDVAFTTGLTIITTTANGSDMTVSYR